MCVASRPDRACGPPWCAGAGSTRQWHGTSPPEAEYFPASAAQPAGAQRQRASQACCHERKSSQLPGGPPINQGRYVHATTQTSCSACRAHLLLRRHGQQRGCHRLVRTLQHALLQAGVGRGPKTMHAAHHERAMHTLMPKLRGQHDRATNYGPIRITQDLTCRCQQMGVPAAPPRKGAACRHQGWSPHPRCAQSCRARHARRPERSAGSARNHGRTANTWRCLLLVAGLQVVHPGRQFPSGCQNAALEAWHAAVPVHMQFGGACALLQHRRPTSQGRSPTQPPHQATA